MSDKPISNKSGESLKKNSSQSTRRQTLKALTVGGAVAGVSNMPKRWAKPVVDLIILPAHAQTTQGQTSPATTSPAPTTCSDTVTVPGGSRSCPDSTLSFYTTYTFFLSNDCIRLRSATDVDSVQTTPGLDQILVGSELTNGWSQFVVETRTYERRRGMRCAGPFDSVFPIVVGGIEVSGRQYEASWTWTTVNSPASIRLSEIVITPV